MRLVAVRVVMGLLVAVIGAGAALAQDPAPKKAKPAPKLDAEALRIPNSIHETQAKTIDRSGKALPAPIAPNKVDLGKYDLEFRARHSSDINPRTGFDSGEKQNLSNTAAGRKGESSLPNYFGLKLSTPTD